MNLTDRIDEVAQERLEARRRGDRAEVARLTVLIDDLYDTRRRAAAQATYGTHDSILRRARIEVELERIGTAR